MIYFAVHKLDWKWPRKNAPKFITQWKTKKYMLFSFFNTFLSSSNHMVFGHNRWNSKQLHGWRTTCYVDQFPRKGTFLLQWFIATCKLIAVHRHHLKSNLQVNLNHTNATHDVLTNHFCMATNSDISVALQTMNQQLNRPIATKALVAIKQQCDCRISIYIKDTLSS